MFESQPAEKIGERMYKVLVDRTDLDRDKLIGEMVRNYRRYNDDPAQLFRIDMSGVLKELPVKLWSLEEWAARQVLRDNLEKGAGQ